MITSWAEITNNIISCDKCRLCETRTNAVPGEGNPTANLMFIGEGPGHDEDVMGRPFVGASGQLLTKMIHAIGIERTDVYIANVVKCRPPGNRNPSPDEIAACMPYLRGQFALIRPKVIVLLGKVAANAVLGEQIFISRDHGKIYERKGVYFIPTYHPSALLRNASMKKDAWEDFKKIRDLLKEVTGGKDEAFK